MNRQNVMFAESFCQHFFYHSLQPRLDGQIFQRYSKQTVFNRIDDRQKQFRSWWRIWRLQCWPVPHSQYHPMDNQKS